MVNNQGYIFLIFTLNGIAIGILFDFFRILRKCFKTNDFMTSLQDIVFWVLSGMIFLYSMCKFCDGELRLFMLIGVCIGCALYIVTFSKTVIAISVYIINVLKKVLAFPIKVILNLTKKIIFRPIIFIYANIRKNMQKFYKKINKKEGFLLKKEKNI